MIGVVELHAAGSDALSDPTTPENKFHPNTWTSTAQGLQYQTHMRL